MPGRRGKSAEAKRAAALKLRAKLWVEIGGKPAMTEATADLLEQIEACGSLSVGGRRLRFSSRGAWLVLDAAYGRWAGPLAITATGGMRGGGTRDASGCGGAA